MKIKSLFLLPVWLSIVCLKPIFPKDHLLKHVTSKQFQANATSAVFFCSLALWSSLFCASCGVNALLKSRS